MHNGIDTATVEQAAKTIRKKLANHVPRVAMILGSGWGKIVESFSRVTSVDYTEIPGLGSATVSGHAGRLLLAGVRNMEILVFQGRRHWYEGQGWTPVSIPVYTALELGAEILVLTNAAGGISPDLAPGNLMVIDDHINAMGVNPLIGSTTPLPGPMFPDQTQVYDAGLRKLFDQASRKCQIPVSHGVYVATSGPAYETPAETRMLASAGAHAVGMSTVPEAMLAHSAGMRVAGISCITNYASGMGSTPLSHEEVKKTGAESMPRMSKLILALIESIAG